MWSRASALPSLDKNERKVHVWQVAQYLKDDVQARIEAAALRVFATRGYGAASMALIAREAGVATGNLYRYFEDKQALFEAVIQPELPGRVASLLRRRVAALEGVAQPRDLPPDAAFHAVSAELLEFVAAHRWELVFLLGRAEGSPHAGFPAQIVRMLEKLALAHHATRHPHRDLEPSRRAMLKLVYEGLLRSTVAILERHHHAGDIRAAMAAYADYHLAGLGQLLA
jgi:AcrR family transcriptional regulator